jgi:hypothetical protein
LLQRPVEGAVACLKGQEIQLLSRKFPASVNREFVGVKQENQSGEQGMIRTDHRLDF